MSEHEWIVVAMMKSSDEGDDYLGFSHTIDGAKKLCEKRNEEFNYHSPLIWKPDFQREGAPAPNEEATDAYKFVVFWDKAEN